MLWHHAVCAALASGRALCLLLGEVSYQVLSLVAKGVLGLILMANVLLYDSFDEAVMEAD